MVMPVYGVIEAVREYVPVPSPFIRSRPLSYSSSVVVVNYAVTSSPCQAMLRGRFLSCWSLMMPSFDPCKGDFRFCSAPVLEAMIPMKLIREGAGCSPNKAQVDEHGLATKNEHPAVRQQN